MVRLCVPRMRLHFMPKFKMTLPFRSRPTSLSLNSPTAVLEAIEPIGPPVEVKEREFEPAPLPQGKALVTAEPEKPTPEVRTVDGLHEYVKNTDYWFNAEVNSLEKFALEGAASHAQVGLPRVDVPVDLETAFEAVLKRRAEELFLGWASRVRRKVQDGIQSSVVAAGEGIAELRHLMDQLVLARKSVEKAERAFSESEKELVGETKTLQYGRLVNTPLYFGLMILLTLVDWVANVPIFGELLPKEDGLENHYKDAVDQIGGRFPGVHALWDRIVYHPEVALMALGVVVVLMVLGHFCGSNARKLTAFSMKDDPIVGQGLRSHRRQALVPCLGAGVALVVIITFLGWSRHQLVPSAQDRVTATEDALKDIRDRQAALQTTDPSAAAELGMQVPEASAKVDAAKHDLTYSKGISAMNWPIVLLNLVLATTAIALAYHHDEARLDETRLVDPKTALLEGKLKDAQREEIAIRQKMRSAELSTQNHLSKTRYPLRTFPLKDWEAKVRRLDSLIPLFRAENARLRGIDVQRIESFGHAWELHFPAVDEKECFETPSELASYEDEFAAVRATVRNLTGEREG